MSRRIEFFLDDIHTYRYDGGGDFAVLICHGAAAWGGMYDVFVEPFVRTTGADVWAWDCPGFGLSGERQGVPFTFDDWQSGLRKVIAEIRACHDKPIFALGSSMGGLMASVASYEDDVRGFAMVASPVAVTTPWYEGFKQLLNNPAMEAVYNSPFGHGLFLDLDVATRFEKNYGDEETARAAMAHPLHVGMITLQSWASIFSWDAPFPLAENTKPFLLMAAERDPMFPVEVAHGVHDAIGGPKRLKIFDTDKHGLLLFHPDEVGEVLGSWCMDNLA